MSSCIVFVFDSMLYILDADAFCRPCLLSVIGSALISGMGLVVECKCCTFVMLFMSTTIFIQSTFTSLHL